MTLKAPGFKDIQQAAARISSFIYRTPLIPLHGSQDVYLKLENLQSIGSFKLRGSGNAMEIAGAERLRNGVCTASAGNMAQGVAWNARRLAIPCTSIVPEHAPQTKIDAIVRLESRILRVPFEEWWDTLVTGRHEGATGLFIHPVCDTGVMAGNGTIGLEILEDLPDVETIFIPFGGGGLSCGIASAVRAIKPAVRIYACEVETAAPLSASLASGAASRVEYIPSFVDGIGGKSVLPQMWPLLKTLLDGAVTVSLQQIADAIRFIAERNHVIAEGAGAASVAAALAFTKKQGKTVCVISGGNIDASRLATIFRGETP